MKKIRGRNQIGYTEFNSNVFIDPFKLLWPTESPKTIVTFHLYNIFCFIYLLFFSFPSLFWLIFFLLAMVVFLFVFFFFVIPVLIFRCAVQFLVRSQSCFPFFFFYCSCPLFFIDPQFHCIPTVCGRRIDRCCRRGIVDCQPLTSWGRGWPSYTRFWVCILPLPLSLAFLLYPLFCRRPV
jgi:hypothetical protein